MLALRIKSVSIRLRVIHLSYMKQVLIMLCLMPLAVQAQSEKPVLGSKLQVTEVQIHPGGYGSILAPSTINDFKLLSQNNERLDQNLSSFEGNGGRTFQNELSFSALVGFRFKSGANDVKFKNPLLRVGIHYLSGNALSSGLFNQTRTTYDTLTSSVTGRTYFVDSVQNHYLGMNYRYEQIRVDFALIYSTNPEKRWALYGGIGGTIGASINAQTEISESKWNYTETVFPNNQIVGNHQFNSSYQSDIVANKLGIGFSGYLPMGVDFRIGNKRVFWQQVHLMYELRPGVNFMHVPELRMIRHAYLNQSIGLKVTL